MDVLYLFIGLIALVIGGEFLVKGAIALAVKMKVSMIVIGLTVVSFATSAPELIVSVYSALNGHPDIALGNVIGSNIANISLVLGLTAILYPLSFEKRLYRFDIPVMLFASILFGFFLYTNSSLIFWEGFVFIALLTVLIIYLISVSRKENEQKNDAFASAEMPIYKWLSFLIIGGLSLYFGTQWLVGGATGIARLIGVSERVISVSVVAFGTSVPELAASIIAASKKEKGLSIGNLIGSNLFNILAVMGVTSMIHPVRVIDQGLLTNDIWWMFGLALLLLPLMFFFTRKRIGRLEGIVLFVLYLVYIFFLF